MSLLNALRERLLGQASMMRPGQGFGGGTQGLLGQGGRFGGGMLQTKMDQPGGLLGGQIPELALLGSALYGQGMQGKDPLEGLFPAYTQAAQVKKALTPEKERLMTAYDPKTGETVFATRTEIEEKGLRPVPQSPETTAAQKNFAALKRIEETGSPLEKRVGRIIFGKPGGEPMSKTDFLIEGVQNALNNLSITVDQVPEYKKQLDEAYDSIMGKIDNIVKEEDKKVISKTRGGRGGRGAKTEIITSEVLPIPENKEDLIDGQSYDVNGVSMKWNKNKNVFE
jgi:molybdenum-dependent DNA-binding transcriptional regulator ModE